jgi:hypothetical protein
MQCHDTFMKQVNSERIDLVYEELTRSLSIRIKYGVFLTENPKITKVLHFPHPLLHQAETIQSHSRRRAKAIATGTSFVYNGKLFVVSASDGVTVSATCAARGVVINMTNDELWQIIMDSIG